MYLALITSIDGLVYTRGSRDDWDNWARITGDEGLTWDNMVPLMLKVTSFKPMVKRLADVKVNRQKT
jgi:choline dehydrogenase